MARAPKLTSRTKIDETQINGANKKKKGMNAQQTEMKKKKQRRNAHDMANRNGEN